MNWHTIVSIAIASAFCAALGGCDAAATTAPTAEGIEGVWTFESVTAKDGTQDKESTEFTQSLGVTAEVVFDDDGTGTLHLFGETHKFTWSRVDDTSARIVLEEGSANVVLENGKLKIEGQQEDGGTGYFVFAPSTETESAEDTDSNPIAAKPET